MLAHLAMPGSASDQANTGQPAHQGTVLEHVSVLYALCVPPARLGRYLPRYNYCVLGSRWANGSTQCQAMLGNVARTPTFSDAPPALDPTPKAWTDSDIHPRVIWASLPGQWFKYRRQPHTFFPLAHLVVCLIALLAKREAGGRDKGTCVCVYVDRVDRVGQSRTRHGLGRPLDWGDPLSTSHLC